MQLLAEEYYFNDFLLMIFQFNVEKAGLTLNDNSAIIV